MKPGALNAVNKGWSSPWDIIVTQFSAEATFSALMASHDWSGGKLEINVAKLKNKKEKFI